MHVQLIANTTSNIQPGNNRLLRDSDFEFDRLSVPLWTAFIESSLFYDYEPKWILDATLYSM